MYHAIKTATKARPVRRKDEVSITLNYLHYLPFTTSRKRISGYSEQREYDWGSVDISAAETINVRDFSVLLAIILYGQNNPSCCAEKTLANKTYIEITVPRSQLYRICGNTHPGDYFGTEEITDDGGCRWHHGHITRLATWSWSINVRGAEPCNMQPLKDFDAEKGIYVVPQAFMQQCLNEGFCIDLLLFGSISDQSTQAFYLYARGHSHNSKGISVRLIATALRLSYHTSGEQRTTRQAIKRILTRLVALRILSDGRITKRGKGEYSASWKRGSCFFGKEE